MRIILIGYRGCGKTTVGRLLAQRLKMTFVDVDDQTCAAFGIDSIADIWRQFGEPQWRRREVEVTRRLCEQDDLVIGLGGGTLMQPQARAAIEACEALRVYLKAPPAVLARRIAGDIKSSETRPNLTNKGGGLEEIRDVLAQREPVYEAVADHILDASLDAQTIADRIAAISA